MREREGVGNGAGREVDGGWWEQVGKGDGNVWEGGKK